MVLQARAEATRRKILDSAVDLFDELGYGETGLADVLQRAGVSKGAFYYHFDSKEAVAAAIIQDYRDRIRNMLGEKLDPSLPLMDQLIVASFSSAAMIYSDKCARIGNELMQGLTQISATATRVYAQWTAEFLDGFARGVQASGFAPKVDVGEVAEAAWTGVLGSHLLSSAIGGDPYIRLARMWRAVLCSFVPEDAQGHFSDLLDRTALRYQSAAV